MKKLYAGLAAAALTATGIACSAGAAHASSAWPSPLGFTPDSSVASVASVLSTDGTQMYTVAIDSTDSSVVDVATTDLVSGATTQDGPLIFDDTSFAPDAVAVAGDGTILLSGVASDADSYAVGNVDSVNASVQTTGAPGNGIAAISADGSHAVVGGDGNGNTQLLPIDLTNAQTGDVIDLGAGNDVNTSTNATAVTVANDGTIDAAVTNWDGSMETDAVRALAWDGAVTGTTSLDGSATALVSLGGGVVAAAIETADDSAELQYVGGSQTETLVPLDDEPSELTASPDGTTVWAIEPNSYGITAIKDGVATTLDGSSTTTDASYGDVFAAAGSNDTLYLVATPWDAADDSDGPTAVYALGTPTETATSPSATFEDATTLAVQFTGVLDAPTPLGYAVTVTDHSNPSHTWTSMAWDAGHSDGTDRATFPDLDPTKAYDISIRSFNGGFLGAPVTASYLPSLGAESAAVSGTPTVGQVVSATVAGAWPTGTTLSYQWDVVVVNGESADLVAIAGATGSSLTLTSDLVGKRIAVVVTGHKDGYADSTAQSSAFGPIAATTVTTPPTVQVPTTVGTIKAATIKAGSKKLTLLLGGVTSAPGKVKIYDGKKLLGSAKISNGTVTLKLKKHLSKGKHKIKLTYAGSAELGGFTKTVKLKVK